jgi:hypothetical protein
MGVLTQRSKEVRKKEVNLADPSFLGGDINLIVIVNNSGQIEGRCNRHVSITSLTCLNAHPSLLLAMSQTDC